MSDWTIDRVLLEPKRAADLLNEYEKLRRQSVVRITDLLEANNRYLERAREAERKLVFIKPLTADALGDAIECFWNAAISEAHARQSTGAMDVASVSAVGMAAIAARLKGQA